jgi:hypothetical protein
VSGINEQFNTHSSECNRKSTQNIVKLKWLTQQIKPLDDFDLDNIKSISALLYIGITMVNYDAKKFK